ncbi:MAG: signal peptidase I [Acidimicrobiales bacterium]|nr:signal peptidase I [Acidimicrobiales bacterium]
MTSTDADNAESASAPSYFDVSAEWNGHEDDIFEDTPELEEGRSALRQTLEWGAVIIGALIAALVIKTFLFQAFFIPSSSMEQTLQINDRVLVNKIAYQYGDISRGDVIVFHRPPAAAPSDTDEFIKRVIGLPGDTLEGIDGVVYVNGEAIDEPYIDPGDLTYNLPVTVVPEGHLWVMGDNRNNSQDSRYFGPISQDLVVGKAFLIVWPPGSIGSL